MPDKHDSLETALVLRAMADRNDAAFGRLVTLHQNRVRAFLQRLCRDTALADDLAQDTFLIAYRKLGDYQGSGSFNGWLCSIAYRCFLQHLRSHKRSLDIDQQFATEPMLQPDRYDGISPEQLDLERALLLIESDEAAAVTLNFTLGFSHSEVADIMQMPLGTVKSHINRGLTKLRTIMSTPRAEKAS